MTHMIRNALVGAGAFAATAIGSFAYWVNGKTKELPTDQKGSLFSRMREVISSFQQSKKIQNSYTAERHLDLTASLSSRSSTLASNRSQKEIDVLRTSYYAGYIPEALQNNPGATPIFRYDENLPAALPTLPGETHKGFLFAGASPQICDAQARDAILYGNYIRCRAALPVPNPKNVYKLAVPDPEDAYKKVDVIVAGTTEQGKCHQFKRDFLRDFAYLAAKQPLDPQHPYSDTPVFDSSEKGIKPTGDLTDMPQQTKEKILSGNFTTCNSYFSQKTRLSGDSHKDIGAIVAGTSNEEICTALAFENHRKNIEAFQAQARKQ